MSFVFTHENRTGTSTEACASVQGAKIQKNYNITYFLLLLSHCFEKKLIFATIIV